MADESENSNGRAPRQRRAAMVNEEKGLLLRHIADLRNQRNKSTSPAVPLHHNNEAHINHRNESHNEYEAHDNGSIQQTHHRSGRIEHTVDSFWPSLDQNDARFFESSMDSGGSGSSSSFQSLPKARTVFQNEASSPSVTPDSKERAADCLVMTSVDRRTTKHDNHSLGGYSDRHKLIPPSGIDFQSSSTSKGPLLRDCLDPPKGQDFNIVTEKADFHHISDCRNHTQMFNISTSTESLAILDGFSPPSVNMHSIPPRHNISGPTISMTTCFISREKNNFCGLGFQNVHSEQSVY